MLISIVTLKAIIRKLIFESDMDIHIIILCGSSHKYPDLIWQCLTSGPEGVPFTAKSENSIYKRLKK